MAEVKFDGNGFDYDSAVAVDVNSNCLKTSEVSNNDQEEGTVQPSTVSRSICTSEREERERKSVWSARRALSTSVSARVDYVSLCLCVSRRYPLPLKIHTRTRRTAKPRGSASSRPRCSLGTPEKGSGVVQAGCMM